MCDESGTEIDAAPPDADLLFFSAPRVHAEVKKLEPLVVALDPRCSLLGESHCWTGRAILFASRDA
jgi:hypothetical protein